MDDEHTLHWEITPRPDGPGASCPPRRAAARPGVRRRAVDSEYQPNTTDWYGRFNLHQTMDNDYLIDRAGAAGMQQLHRHSGHSPAGHGRHRVAWGRSSIARSEHLGTTDALIIRTRRRMIAAARALEQQGVIPPGVDNPELYRQRSGGVLLPREVNWWDATAQRRTEFSPAAHVRTLIDRRFRFGVLASRAETAGEWRELARKVEDLGYSTLLIADHFGRQLAPLPALVAAAERHQSPAGWARSCSTTTFGIRRPRPRKPPPSTC